MLFYPNAKINIGLNIIDKRPDGFHNLETIFYPIPFYDILEIVPDPKGGFASCIISQSGISFDGQSEDNICIKAYNLLSENFKLPAVIIHLHKQIPVGAGLGGGSADAAESLKGLNKMFQLGLSQTELESYCSSLGADCAFFIENRPKFATGIGDEFEACDVNLTGKYLVLACPDIHSSTAEAYGGVQPEGSKKLKEFIQFQHSQWKSNIVNDFEKSIFPLYPVVENIKIELYSKGAMFASMSGSGSSVFGIFEQEPNCYFELGDTDYHIFKL